MKPEKMSIKQMFYRWKSSIAKSLISRGLVPIIFNKVLWQHTASGINKIVLRVLFFKTVNYDFLPGVS